MTSRDKEPGTDSTKERLSSSDTSELITFQREKRKGRVEIISPLDRKGILIHRPLSMGLIRASYSLSFGSVKLGEKLSSDVTAVRKGVLSLLRQKLGVTV